jgi:hypothetical protein
VIAEWNVIHAKDRKTVLMPIGWETDARPEMGDRPQAIISRQLLKDADLLVAIFWTRIGSPTGVARSGTVEEIEEHIGAHRPAMIYFSSALVSPESIDGQQYSELMEFKESLKKRGLLQQFKTPAEFRSIFTRHLAQTIISHFPAGAEPKADNSVVEATPAMPTRVPTLSESARDLLVEASKDGQGVIMSLQTLGGSHVQTNGREFVQGGVRAQAQWRGAVADLEALGLIEDRAGMNEVFFVTDEGYRVAETLSQRQ